ncbi:MAG: hypothetical protein P8J87_16035 [Verrucomicrobiales bacterium]|nr:hypothetical protein [Verrucomicrobiales bacterium]
MKIFLTLLLTTTTAVATPTTEKDIAFAKTAKLDLYQPNPSTENPAPLIVCTHGGAWRRGSRHSVPIKTLTGRGFAIAPIGYRLKPITDFLTQHLI